MNPSAIGSLNDSLLSARMASADPPSPLRELTTGLARGDDLAWAKFHRDYGPGIFRQLLAATYGDHALASEALQETYLRVARHARPCGQETAFLSWLKVVARTALSDCRRRRMSFWQLLRRRREDPTELGDARTAVAEEDRRQDAIDAGLAAIAAEDRALLEAKYLSGRDVRSIAEDLGISPKAVESRLTRARAELRRHLLVRLARHEE